MSLVAFMCAGCSTISFSNKDGVFDGTYHAASSLVCSGYWSDRDWQRTSRGRSLPARTAPALGLFVYSLIDVPASFLGDIIALIPNALIRGGAGRPAFDVRDHQQPWQCGSLQHSIHTIGSR